MTTIDMTNTATESKGVMPYQFDGRNIRIVEKDGEFWFVGTDIASELGYATAKDMARLLDEDERDGHNVPTAGGWQNSSVKLKTRSSPTVAKRSMR